jgi:hypothetical protein
MGGLTQSASDFALTQVKENRAIIDSLVSRWGLEEVEEAKVKTNVMDKPTSDITMDDLRGQSVALLGQLLKKCPPGSREHKLVKSQLDKQGPASQAKPKTSGLVLKSGKKIDKSFKKYFEMGPGQIKLAVQKLQQSLHKLKKGKASASSRMEIEKTTKEIETIGAIFNDKVQYSGLLMKKGGKKGSKGTEERWFALEHVGEGTYSLEYYNPKVTRRGFELCCSSLSRVVLIKTICGACRTTNF